MASPTDGATGPAEVALTTHDVDGSTAGAAFPAAERSTLPEHASPAGDGEQLTLLSGQTVTAVQSNGETGYRTTDDAALRRVETADGTYVLPAGVDLERFSPALFDVDYLFRNGYDDAESTRVVVSLDADFDSGQHRAWAAQMGLRFHHRLEDSDAIVASVPASDDGEAFRNLRTSPVVEYVSLDTGPASDARTTQSTDDGDAAAAGDEPVVAVIDTGVDETHPDLDDGAEVLEKDYTETGGEATDVSGHGTHVAGVMLGSGDASDGRHAGVASDAKYMDLKVANTAGGGKLSDVLSAIEFASKNGADVIYVGVDVDADRRQVRTLVEPAVDAAVERGSLVVAPVGGKPVPKTSPDSGVREFWSASHGIGAAPGVLTVGTTTPQGDVAAFSERGPTASAHLAPDVVAPGFYVRGAASDDRIGADEVESDYTTKTGTSVSAALVGGHAAALLSERADLQPSDVESLLVSTADPLEGRNVYEHGGGSVDASHAANTTLYVSPGTISFGARESGTTLSRVVTIENTGDDARTVSLDATAVEIADDRAGAVELNRSTVTVPAGDSAAVRLTVETGSDGGVYAGRLTVTPERGDSLSTSFGYARSHTLRVNKTAGGDAQDVASDPLLVTSNVPEYERSRLTSLNDSTMTYRTFGNDVTVGSIGSDERTGEMVMVAKTVDVDGDGTVVLNESDTVRYEIDAGALEETAGNQMALYSEGVIQRRFAGDGKSTLFELRSVRARQQSVRFSQSPEFNASVAATLVPRSSVSRSSENFDAPDVYLLHYATVGVDGPETFTAEPGRLAEIDVTYYRNGRGSSYSVIPYVQTVTWREGGSLGIPLRIGDRVRQTVHVTPQTAAYGFGAYGGGEERQWGGWANPQVPRADSSRIVTVNVHPTTGRLLKWRLQDGRFTTKAAQKKDLSHEVLRDFGPEPNTFVVDIGNDSARVFDSQGPGAVVKAPLPVAEGESVTLYTIGRNPSQNRSTMTQSVYHGTYEPGTDTQPPRLDVYWLENLTVYNTVPRGEATVRLKVKEDSNVTVLGAIGKFDVATVSGDEPKEVVQRALENDDYEALLSAFVEGSVAPDAVSKVGPQTYEVTADTSSFSEGDRLDVRVLAVDESGNLMMVTSENATVIGDGPAGPGEGAYKSEEGITVPTTTEATTTSSTTAAPTTATATETPSTSAPTRTTKTTAASDGSPGFSGLVAVLAVVAAVALGLRKRD
ncbi:S8 family serine peptidase [Halorubellus litoreus]|uniref:S8 family serine peptidase n=1 Tax=Halorubellus litoreus TaxID=755308 RepID=A0ABD5V8Z3_9EURY